MVSGAHSDIHNYPYALIAYSMLTLSVISASTSRYLAYLSRR